MISILLILLAVLVGVLGGLLLLAWVGARIERDIFDPDNQGL